jgi:hypothetical protein
VLFFEMRRFVLCILYYIKRTSSLRLSRKVFISFVSYQEDTTCTLARWLWTVLNLSDIDSNIYKAHSYRGASALAVYNKGCSLMTIISHANWKSDKNFKKFYYGDVDKNIPYNNAVFEG